MPDLDKLIENMPENHLQCRDFGHSWRPHTATWDPKARCYVTQLRCSRCRTLRERIIDANGQQVTSHYDYPDGYLVHGLGRLSPGDRNHVRLITVLRTIGEGERKRA
jgi:hypothetical protein